MASIFSNLQPPDNKTHIEVKDAMNSDIRRVLEQLLPEASKEAQPLAKHFKGATPLDTARNIWNYERQVIKYKKDSEEHQDIRMPRRFHHDKDGDCKTFSLNALAIYKAIYPDLPVAYKYTAYRPGAEMPSHVYAVVKDYNGNKIIIDGCYNFFNSEKEYTFSLPLKYDMQVRVLSGIEIPTAYQDIYNRLSPEVQARLDRALKAQLELEKLKRGKTTQAAAMGALENCISAKPAKKHSPGQNALHWLDIGVLALGRGAYDALVAMNLNGMADKLLIMRSKYPAQWKKITNLYYELGGYEKALVKAATIGAKHRPIFLSPKAKQRYENKFGADSRELGLKPPKGFAGLNDDMLSDDMLTGECIGVIAAATAGAAAPVLGAMLAGLAKAFHSAGDTNNASETLAQTQDHIALSQPGQPLDPNALGNTTIPVPPPAPNLPALPATASQGTPDPNSGVDPSVFSQAIGIGDVWSDIGGAIGGLFHLGMKKLKDKLNSAANVNPALKQLGNVAIDGASFITNKAMGQLGQSAQGYLDKLVPHPDPGATKAGERLGMGAGLLTPVNVVIAAGLLYAVTRK